MLLSYYHRPVCLSGGTCRSLVYPCRARRGIKWKNSTLRTPLPTIEYLYALSFYAAPIGTFEVRLHGSRSELAVGSAIFELSMEL